MYSRKGVDNEGAQVQKNAAANLVCFVVVLWIILKDLRLFSVLEGAHEIVDSASEFLPPLFIGNEPIA
jgi:hypothetical protein